ALSFFASAALCAPVVAHTPRLAHHAERTLRSAFSEYRAGLRILGRQVDTLLVVSHKGVNCLLITGALNSLLVVVAARHFNAGAGPAANTGLLFCATGIGSALGPLLAQRFTQQRERALRYGLVLGYAISALGLAIAAPLASFASVLVGVLVHGVGGGMLFA